MLKAELAEIIQNGENSGVEFKRDDVHPDSLAKEIAALANLEGGRILLGVEDNGAISGLTKTPAVVEQLVMNLCRENLQPAMIPYWEIIRWEEGRQIGVITIPADAPDKPYRAKRGGAWVTHVRVGSTSREASREEEVRLFQASGLVRYDLRPVPGATINDLDRDFYQSYFRDMLRRKTPAPDDEQAWTKLLLNTEILREDRGRIIPTVAGMLLFGIKPKRYLPQSGITATAYKDTKKDYDTVDEEDIRGPLVHIVSPRGRVVEPGVIDRAVNFVARNTGTVAWLEGARRRRVPVFPVDAVREAIVNAVAHRDYTMWMMDIEVSLYSDRLEVISPGRLPNSVTVEKMKQGYRSTRNELLKDVLRDYEYVESRGMGVLEKIIAGMRAHNGTEPDLIEEESRFVVRLWKKAPVKKN
ncbi:putative DNA binding domain-containing protein [candidate division KSB1 bacterium]|nr:putative DNA binding domain-containing protein [candidate division KSB1 bacterium]